MGSGFYSYMFFYIRGSALPVTDGLSKVDLGKIPPRGNYLGLVMFQSSFRGENLRVSVSLYIPVVATLVDKLFYLSHKIKLLLFALYWLFNREPNN